MTKSIGKFEDKFDRDKDRISHFGVELEHGKVSVDKNMSTCLSPYKQNAVFSQNVVSLN